MDVKSTVLNGFIEDEVYVQQPSWFVDYTHPDFIFKLKNALYSLKQAPRACYEGLSSFIIDKGFVNGKVDTTLFTKHVDNDFLIVQIYVNDIIFGSTNEKLYKDFKSCMKKEFKMSMMGELNYFLGLQVK